MKAWWLVIVTVSWYAILLGFFGSSGLLQNYIEGFQPESYISTIYHCRNTSFWLETLDIKAEKTTNPDQTKNPKHYLTFYFSYWTRNSLFHSSAQTAVWAKQKDFNIGWYDSFSTLKHIQQTLYWNICFQLNLSFFLRLYPKSTEWLEGWWPLPSNLLSVHDMVTESVQLGLLKRFSGDWNSSVSSVGFAVLCNATSHVRPSSKPPFSLGVNMRFDSIPPKLFRTRV